MAGKQEDEDQVPPAEYNRFYETGAGARIFRPGKGEIDTRSLPPERVPGDPLPIPKSRDNKE